MIQPFAFKLAGCVGYYIIEEKCIVLALVTKNNDPRIITTGGSFFDVKDLGPGVIFLLYTGRSTSVYNTDRIESIKCTWALLSITGGCLQGITNTRQSTIRWRGIVTRPVSDLYSTPTGFITVIDLPPGTPGTIYYGIKTVYLKYVRP